jgi:hypothetical protein
MREYSVIGRDGKPSGESPARIAQLFNAEFRAGRLRKGVSYQFIAGRFVQSARKRSTARSIYSARLRIREHEFGLVT